MALVYFYALTSNKVNVNISKKYVVYILRLLPLMNYYAQSLIKFGIYFYASHALWSQ
jgi:hypothetical protein